MCAGLTHGYPSGYLTSGVLAVLIFALVDGATLNDALAQTRSLLKTYLGHKETLDALDEASELSTFHPPHHAMRASTCWI